VVWSWSLQKIWEKTKELSGYKYNPQTKRADGLGFSDNDKSVFSGEWTLGAINMLRIFAKQYNDNSFSDEAAYMRDAIERELKQEQNINGENVVGVSYSNKRYFIPFGWWANPVLSSASTGWTALVDRNFNPFYLGGNYDVNYPK